MQQEVAEKKIRALQKEFLTKIETHPAFLVIPPDDFNKLRKRVFRGTFSAYRMGVVGVERNDEFLVPFFIGWLSGLDTKLEPAMHMEISEMCFRTSIAAFRIGAMVASGKETDN
jgi:hypothetical protein